MAMMDEDVRSSSTPTTLVDLNVDQSSDMTKNTPVMSNNLNCGSDEIDFQNDSEINTVSLQEAFQKFRKTRQANLRECEKMKKKQRKKNRNPAQMEALRYKFIEQTKKYFGVPYAKKYWTSDSEEYKSPLFLDCCGLVRRVMRDLTKDFGFYIGPWNQSYMFDTLPITVDREEDMKPGDLVFMSGIYTNPKNKKQRHDMTHVEIWLGDGPKTIGSRWNNGKVQIFDSYRFEAKSFHSEKYYFKSIDTWLKGICKSFCPEHPWRKSVYKPGKRSIFRPDDELEEEDERAGDSSSGTDVELEADNKDRMKKDMSSRMDVKVENPVDCMLSPLTTCTFMHDDHKEFGPHIHTTNNKHRYVMDDTTDKTPPLTGNTLLQPCHHTNHSTITCNHHFTFMSINKSIKQNESKTDCSEFEGNLNMESDVKNVNDDSKQLDPNEKEIMKKASLRQLEIDVKIVSDDSIQDNHKKKEIMKKPTLKHVELESEGLIPSLNLLTDEITASTTCLLVEKESNIVGDEWFAAEKHMPHICWCVDELNGTGKSTQQVESSLKDIDDVTELKLEDVNHHLDAMSSSLHIDNEKVQRKENLSNLEKQFHSSTIQTTEECPLLSDDDFDENSHDGSSDQEGIFIDHPHTSFIEAELDSDRFCLSDECQCCCDCDNCLEDAPAFQGIEAWNCFVPIFPNVSLPENELTSNDPSSELMLCCHQEIQEKPLPITPNKQLDYLDESMLDRNQNYLNVDKEIFLKNHETTKDLSDIGSNLKQGARNSLSQHVKENNVEIQEPEDSDRCVEGSQSSPSKSESKSDCEGVDSKGSSGGDGKGEEKGDKRRGGGGNPGGRSSKLPACHLPSNMMNTFYIGGGNGVALVEGALLNLGWKRTTDKYDDRFKLKWVECKSRINYQSFREGDQLVNHIPNCHLLTNKLGLINSLQEYERVTLSTRGRPPRLKLSDIVPETYKLDDKNDRESFLQTYKDGEMWICKPTGMNQGKGIFLLRTKEEIDKLLSEREEKLQQRKPTRPLMSRIVQRYIHNPLLLDGRKFDIRAYMLIASTTPFLVLYHKGYVRLSCMPYDGDDTNLTTHLTNQYIQKKDPNYQDVKEDTAWSMDKFNDYINEKVAPEKNLEQNWVYDCLTKQMQRVMLHCFNSVKHKLQSKIGYFDLYGLDFMIDTDMKVWMIEINVNPALSTNCSALKDVIPSVVEESINVSIECFEKSRKRQTLMPLNTLKGFTVLYCGSQPSAVASRNHRCSSPAKDNTDKNIKSTQNSTNRKPVSPSRSFVPKTTPSSTVVPAMSKSGTSDADFIAKSPYNTTSMTTNKSTLSQNRNTVQKQGNKQSFNKKPESQRTDVKSDKTSPKSSASSSPSNKSTSQSSSPSREDVKLRMVHSNNPSTQNMDKNDRGN